MATDVQHRVSLQIAVCDESFLRGGAGKVTVGQDGALEIIEPYAPERYAAAKQAPPPARSAGGADEASGSGRDPISEEEYGDLMVRSHFTGNLLVRHLLSSLRVAAV